MNKVYGYESPRAHATTDEWLLYLAESWQVTIGSTEAGWSVMLTDPRTGDDFLFKAETLRSAVLRAVGG